ncbi:MAG TPA: prepilin-type N-terminal cleavage/methylation domain-containing protein, partial [Candidatus Limnocylindrales bacterium]|nr:prepilin-type N-terminal cleavage/methylation domain-containing protein [Candidatus Limnocylindrales bacterium]
MDSVEVFVTAPPEQPRRLENGFSLIELLIVVAIILIIAAIAIPSLMKAKIAANEAGAGESVRTITTGETTYAAA